MDLLVVLGLSTGDLYTSRADLFAEKRLSPNSPSQGYHLGFQPWCLYIWRPSERENIQRTRCQGPQPHLFLYPQRTLNVWQWAGVGAAWPSSLSPEMKVLLRSQFILGSCK